MSALIDEALRVAQEYELAIFPVSNSKRPIIKGWQRKATTDPDEIRELFSMPGAAGIGVPCGPENDLICFDLDLGHTDDEDRKDKLRYWLDKWSHILEPRNEVIPPYMIRLTRSGGLHMLMAWPSGKRPPRRIMPKLDVIIEGFYFVWWMDDGSYSHLTGELTDLPPEPGMLDVVERDTLGSGASIMSPEEAHEAMWSDGDAGMRHDALLRMTQDWAREHPEQSPDEMCDAFSAWFQDIYVDRIDLDRLEQLTTWNMDPETGELSGELGRAFAGIKTSFVQASGFPVGRIPERSGYIAPASQPVSPRLARKTEIDVGQFQTVAFDELMQTDLPDIDWIIQDLIPRGNLVGLAGPSGAGKTRWVAALATALAAGRPELIGMPDCEPAKALYVANEERSMDVRRRLKAFAALNGVTPDLPTIVRGKEYGQFRLTSGEHILDDAVDALIDVVKQRAVDVVVFDPFVTLGAEEENAASGVGMVIEAMQRIAMRTGAAVVFIHHTPKGERGQSPDIWRGDPAAFRGSGAIYSPLDVAVTLTPYMPEEASGSGIEAGKKRKKLIQQQRNKRVSRFVVLDSAKERESQGFESVVFRLEGQEVRPGGLPIGALKQVPMAEAEAELTQAISTASTEVEEVLHRAWAEAVLDAIPEVGRHALSLQHLVDILDKKKPKGWVVRKGKARVSTGSGKAAVATLGTMIRVGGVSCFYLHGTAKSEWIVDA